MISNIKLSSGSSNPNYDFSERGLISALVSIRLFMASTPPAKVVFDSFINESYASASLSSSQVNCASGDGISLGSTGAERCSGAQAVNSITLAAAEAPITRANFADHSFSRGERRSRRFDFAGQSNGVAGRKCRHRPRNSSRRRFDRNGPVGSVRRWRRELNASRSNLRSAESDGAIAGGCQPT